ncbi:hypothetical protein [Pseudoruminococcus massiliensis]|uniref:hypothetical protein n=1 Tax=Pseudoruminococcus massiliensis TaxID=2086583 RepID=UPI000D0EB6A0|nr:hypothetical protein [Pseudoruminococcus massiliensis]
MSDISFQQILSKTIIEVDNNFLEKIWDSLEKHIRREYVPPLFSDYTIILTEKGANRKIIEKSFEETVYFSNLSIEDQKKAIDKALKENGLSEDIVRYYYVKYFSATEWEITVFETEKDNKIEKVWTVECVYKNTPSEDGEFYGIKVKLNKYDDNSIDFKNRMAAKYGIYNMSDYARQIGTFALDLVNAISYYMQHYNPDVEYKLIKVEEPKKSKKKNGNAGYRQKIVLKSKISRYVLSDETHKTNIDNIRIYRKIKPCWYVRGYYQHYGKDKILKYIPPRINYRRDISKTEDLQPTPNRYLIENDDK